MAKTTPKIQRNQLYTDGRTTPVCVIDSPAWFAWLETAATFRYFSRQRLPMGHHYYRSLRPISVRKEKRAARLSLVCLFENPWLSTQTLPGQVLCPNSSQG